MEDGGTGDGRLGVERIMREGGEDRLSRPVA
jgi:hypothetical protein